MARKVKDSFPAEGTDPAPRPNAVDDVPTANTEPVDVPVVHESEFDVLVDEAEDVAKDIVEDVEHAAVAVKKWFIKDILRRKTEAQANAAVVPTPVVAPDPVPTVDPVPAPVVVPTPVVPVVAPTSNTAAK